MEVLCKLMQVSRAGYYAWCKRPDSRRTGEDKRLGELIQLSFKRSRETYGYRRVQRDLRASGEWCGKERILRLMREKKHST